MPGRTLVTEGPFIELPRSGRVLPLVILLSLALLAGCASRSSRAPVSDHSFGATSSPTSTARGTYVVKAGDTLYKIAQAHGMDTARLAQLNNITDPTQLAIGQTLRLDSGTPLPGNGATTAPVTAAPAPATPAQPGAEEAAPSAPAVSSTATRASDANLVSWGWPVSGKIIQGFNNTTKGIDIEGNVGDPVVAAADGKVMYAGNGVRGLGNLILLGHSDGFITAYAHNQTLLVKTGAVVKKGTKIATVGQSDTTSPRLHFEIRRRGTPVNPLSYLPAR